MAVAWPGTIPSTFEADGFRIGLGSSVIKSAVEVGLPKFRRRSTREPSTFSGTIRMTLSQYNLFETFFKVSLNGGVTEFTALHPLTQTTQRFRLSSTPDPKLLGGANVDVSMSWEEVFGA